MGVCDLKLQSWASSLSVQCVGDVVYLSKVKQRALDWSVKCENLNVEPCERLYRGVTCNGIADILLLVFVKQTQLYCACFNHACNAVRYSWHQKQLCDNKWRENGLTVTPRGLFLDIPAVFMSTVR